MVAVRVMRLLGAEISLRLVVVGALLAAWSWLVWRVLAAVGLFRWLGLDYALFRAQSDALRVAGPSALYNLDALSQQLQQLTKFTTASSIQLTPGPVPFPPIFGWAFGVFSFETPIFGFLLWTGFNLLAAIHLGRRAAGFFPQSHHWWVMALVLTSFPVVYTLFVGQPVILLACALAEAYLAFSQGRSMQAGLWVSCLLLKPQYGWLIGLLLIWKRQWSAVAGAAAGIALILGTSLLAVGPAALGAYPMALRELSAFNGSGTLAYPEQHINWRGAVLRLAPNVDDRTGMVIVLGLGTLTVAALLWAWRGPWDPRKFPSQFTLLTTATLLANYHSHVHGAVLLAVPIAALAAQPNIGKRIRLSIKLLVIGPALVFLIDGNVTFTAWLLFLALLVLFGSLLWELRTSQARVNTTAISSWNASPQFVS